MSGMITIVLVVVDALTDGTEGLEVDIGRMTTTGVVVVDIWTGGTDGVEVGEYVAVGDVVESGAGGASKPFSTQKPVAGAGTPAGAHPYCPL